MTNPLGRTDATIEGSSERTIYLVSCVARKGSQRTAAKDLYRSAWFKKARAHVEASGCPWFILSAEHGLVAPETLIEPYDTTLNTMGAPARRAWAAEIAGQLRKQAGGADRIVVLAGARYREYLMQVLRELANEIEVPLEGLRIGEQLRWLSDHADD